MNTHFLELFYYVARHGGISAAVRHIPYGIQQPAVSTQMGKLEDELGAKLFERVPFRLTPAGELLYGHIAPFFNGLPAIAEQIRSVEAAELRIGGAELILRDHLPAVLRSLRARYPRLRYSLRTLGFQSEAEQWLRNGDIDVAFQPLNTRPPAKFAQKPLACLPLVLKVPKSIPYRTADEIFATRRVSLPLICLPARSMVAVNFQAGLKKRGVHWPQSIEATSLDLVERYVANGDGIGVSVQVQRKQRSSRVRSLRLEGFAPIVIGALWYGTPSAATRSLVEGVQAYAKRTWPEAACG
jgi:DNA-binding transcriptional LysR family regulator